MSTFYHQGHHALREREGGLVARDVGIVVLVLSIPRFGRLLTMKLDFRPGQAGRATLYWLEPRPLTELRRPALTPKPWRGVTPPKLGGSVITLPDIFATLGACEVLVQHPYDRFATSVGAFVDQAADDPDVLAIKQTLYRTSDEGEAPIVRSLVRAAEAALLHRLRRPDAAEPRRTRRVPHARHESGPDAPAGGDPLGEPGGRRTRLGAGARRLAQAADESRCERPRAPPGAGGGAGGRRGPPRAGAATRTRSEREGHGVAQTICRWQSLSSGSPSGGSSLGSRENVRRERSVQMSRGPNSRSLSSRVRFVSDHADKS